MLLLAAQLAKLCWLTSARAAFWEMGRGWKVCSKMGGVVVLGGEWEVGLGPGDMLDPGSQVAQNLVDLLGLPQPYPG